MKYSFSEEHIFLEKKEVAKVADFFEKEFGITNINRIKATPNTFEISRLCFKNDDSLGLRIVEEINNATIQNFKKFAENYNSDIELRG